jgi:hypothetical protein
MLLAEQQDRKAAALAVIEDLRRQLAEVTAQRDAAVNARNQTATAANRQAHIHQVSTDQILADIRTIRARASAAGWCDSCRPTAKAAFEDLGPLIPDWVRLMSIGKAGTRGDVLCPDSTHIAHEAHAWTDRALGSGGFAAWWCAGQVGQEAPARECPGKPLTPGAVDDGLHCDHYWDGGKCCRCQAPAEAAQEASHA